MCLAQVSILRWGRLILFLSVPWSAFCHSTRCEGTVQRISVTSQSTGIIYSPNYPHKYPDSDTCWWLLRTEEEGQVVELQVTDIELYAEGDYITVYDGDNSSSPVLQEKISDPVILRSTGPNMLVTFVADRALASKGFVMKYHSTAPYSSSCVEGQVRTLTVTDTPVLLQLSALNDTRWCQWRVEGGSGTRLVLEQVHFSGALPCSEGNLTMYDGGSAATSVEVGRWCGSQSQPFSFIFSSDTQFLLTTSLLPASDRTRDVSMNLWVQVKATPNTGDCDEHGPIDLVFEGAPLYFPMPFTYLQSRVECTVRVHHPTEDSKGFRVDVVTTGDRRATCEDSLEPAVWISDGKRVDPDCWRGATPVYWARTRLISVLPRQNTTSFLRVQPVSGYPCTGYLIDNFYTGFHDFTSTVSDFGYLRNAQCQFLIRAKEDQDHPVVNIRTHFLAEDGCGDVLTIYNGSTTEGDVLLRFCGSDEYLIDKKVVSPSNTMLVVLTTDDDDNFGDDIDMKYYSVPEADLCEGTKTVYATPTPHILQSPNFPHYYPLNYDCFYTMTTNVTGHVLHVKMTSTGFQRSGDFLDVTDHGSEDKYLGRVSGGDRLREFTSTKQRMTIRFYSDDVNSSGGWQLRYYSAPPSEQDADDMTFNTMTFIVAGVLGAIVVVLIVLVVVVYCRRNSYSPPAVQL